MRAAARAAPTAPCKITVPGSVGAGLVPCPLQQHCDSCGRPLGPPLRCHANHRSRFRRGGACPRPLESQLELERPGKRVFSDPSCEPSPDRISKDVEGRLIERLVVPQDSLKETPLPEPTGSSSFQTREGAQRLPRSDECGQRCLSPDSHQASDSTRNNVSQSRHSAGSEGARIPGRNQRRQRRGFAEPSRWSRKRRDRVPRTRQPRAGGVCAVVSPFD